MKMRFGGFCDAILPQRRRVGTCARPTALARDWHMQIKKPPGYHPKRLPALQKYAGQ
jgi:hypothetical protein